MYHRMNLRGKADKNKISEEEEAEIDSRLISLNLTVEEGADLEYKKSLLAALDNSMGNSNSDLQKLDSWSPNNKDEAPTEPDLFESYEATHYEFFKETKEEDKTSDMSDITKQLLEQINRPQSLKEKSDFESLMALKIKNFETPNDEDALDRFQDDPPMMTQLSLHCASENRRKVNQHIRVICEEMTSLSTKWAQQRGVGIECDAPEKEMKRIRSLYGCNIPTVKYQMLAGQGSRQRAPGGSSILNLYKGNTRQEADRDKNFNVNANRKTGGRGRGASNKPTNQPGWMAAGLQVIASKIIPGHSAGEASSSAVFYDCPECSYPLTDETVEDHHNICTKGNGCPYCKNVFFMGMDKAMIVKHIQGCKKKFAPHSYTQTHLNLKDEWYSDNDNDEEDLHKVVEREKQKPNTKRLELQRKSEARADEIFDGDVMKNGPPEKRLRRKCESVFDYQE